MHPFGEKKHCKEDELKAKITSSSILNIEAETQLESHALQKWCNENLILAMAKNLFIDFNLDKFGLWGTEQSGAADCSDKAPHNP